MRMWLKPEEYKPLGEVLAAARERAGLSQQELADKLTKPQSFISSYERGGRRVDVLELHLIAEALGASPIELFKSISHRFTVRRRIAKRG
jgi:transcriptional regulator with XRE-family HTH domain